MNQSFTQTGRPRRTWLLRQTLAFSLIKPLIVRYKVTNDPNLDVNKVLFRQNWKKYIIVEVIQSSFSPWAIDIWRHTFLERLDLYFSDPVVSTFKKSTTASSYGPLNGCFSSLALGLEKMEGISTNKIHLED